MWNIFLKGLKKHYFCCSYGTNLVLTVMVPLKNSVICKLPSQVINSIFTESHTVMSIIYHRASFRFWAIWWYIGTIQVILWILDLAILYWHILYQCCSDSAICKTMHSKTFTKWNAINSHLLSRFIATEQPLKTHLMYVIQFIWKRLVQLRTH